MVRNTPHRLEIDMEYVGFVIKFTLSLLLILIMITLIATTLLLSADPNKYKNVITEQFANQTGQKLILAGPVQVTWIPIPQVKLADASIVIHYQETPIIVSAKSLKLDFDWKTLLTSDKKISSFVAQKIMVAFFEGDKMIKSLEFPSFSGKLANTCCDTHITDFKLQAGENIFSGDFSADYHADAITQINATLKAKKLTVNIENTDYDKVNDHFIKTALEKLKNVHAKITLATDDLLLNSIHFYQNNLTFSLNDKKLVLASQAKLKQGNFAGNFSLQQIKSAEIELSSQYSIRGNQSNTNIESALIFRLAPNDIHVSGKIASPRWILSADNLPTKIGLQWLNNVTGQVALHTDSLVYDTLNFEHVDATLEIKKDSLILAPRGTLAQGKFTSKISLQTNSANQNTYALNFSMQQANASEFLKLFHSSATLQGGTLDMQFQGTTAGDNVGAMKANLSGKTLIQIKNMTILNQQIDSRYVDFFAALWKAFSNKKNTTVLECAAVRMDINQGKAQAKDGIGLETQDLYSLGSGTFDFKSQQLDFVFTLYPRSQMNIEIGSYNNIVFLKGTLNHPQVVTSAQGLIKEGGSIILGVATGGISILAEKLVKLAAQHQSPCKKIMSNN